MPKKMKAKSNNQIEIDKKSTNKINRDSMKKL